MTNKIELTENIQVTALVENTETIAAAIATGKEISQGTGQKTFVLLIGFARLDLFVTARQSGLGTALLLGGLQVLGAARATGEGDGSSGKEGSDGKELHCD